MDTQTTGVNSNRNSLFNDLERATFANRERELVNKQSQEVIPFWKQKRVLFLERALSRFGDVTYY